MRRFCEFFVRFCEIRRICFVKFKYFAESTNFLTHHARFCVSVNL
ncbi:hypothetical protein ACWIUD_04165 [Helicobacter sp. 23-1044]